MEYKRTNANNSLLSVGIVGGGLTGIAAALKLAESGRFSVTVFEKEDEIGGLSSSYKWQDLTCDRFYHVILPTDAHLLNFIRNLGLESSLFWAETKTGFYGNGRLASLSSTRDFLKFPFLSLWHKSRLGLGILYAHKKRDARKLDSMTARAWLTKLFGARLYEKIWQPLLRSKFGDAHDRVSASLIWATIKRLYGTRSSVEKRESMGHVMGGYKSVFEAARNKLRNNLWTKIITGSKIEKAAVNRQNRKITVISTSNTFEFDKLLLTIPCQEVLRIIEDNKEHPYWRRLAQIEYLGVVCLLLVLKRRLSPYYVINLLDRALPFTGIVESTNVISPLNYGDRHLVYLPKYVTKDDPLVNLSEYEISSLFLEKLRRVFPDLNDKDILREKIFREKYVQPVLDLGYLERQVGFRTPVPCVYLVNSSMIANSTLNNNAIINLADKAADIIIKDDVCYE